MKVVLMNGGLGNQVFQYIFARYIEIHTNTPVLINDSSFFINQAKGTTQHNGFEIDKVFPNHKLNLLSDWFGEDIWNFMIEEAINGKPIIQQLHNMGSKYTHIYEHCGQFDNLSQNTSIKDIPLKANDYHSNITLLKKSHIYYSGYWIHRDYFYHEKVKELLLQELQFPPIPDEKNKAYAKQIQETFSIAIHVRRGDFVTLNLWNGTKFFHDSVTQMRAIYAYQSLPTVFFLFSDDVPWCREHMEELGFLPEDEVVFMEGNMTDEKNYIDMQLMSMTKSLIVPKSSFSYLAALLNQNKVSATTNHPTRTF